MLLLDLYLLSLRAAKLQVDLVERYSDYFYGQGWAVVDKFAELTVFPASSVD